MPNEVENVTLFCCCRLAVPPPPLASSFVLSKPKSDLMLSSSLYTSIAS